MKTRNLLVLLGASALLSACIPSVNPFYTPQDVVFDQRLVGYWQAKDKSEEHQRWSFEDAQDNSYKLTVTGKDGQTGQFTARLFQLKKELFLDLITTKVDYATNQIDLV